MLRNIKWSLAICSVLATGLVGCANNDTAENENYMDNTGYHSTEKNDLVRHINYQEPMREMVDGLYDKDDAYSESDRNYHGHESKQLHPRSSYYNAYEGKLVDRINAQATDVDSVIDSRAIVMKDEILVALLLDDYDQATEAKQAVRKEIGPFTKGRTIYVTTDEGIYYRTMTLDNNLRDGDTRELIVLDANDLFDNLNIHEDHLR